MSDFNPEDLRLSEAELISVLNDNNAHATTMVRPEETAGFTATEQSVVQSADECIDDAFDDEVFVEDLEAQRTLQPFASSPIGRLGLASAVGLLVVLIVGSLIGGIGGGLKKAQKSATDSQVEFANPMVQQRNPDGDLKSQMAFQTQAQMMQAQAAAAPPVQRKSKVSAPSVKPSQRPTPTLPKPASPPVPRPIRIARTVRSAPPPSARPAPTRRSARPIRPIQTAPPPISRLNRPTRSASPSPVSVAASPQQIAPPPPTDPNAVWQTLAQSATYGVLPVMNPPTPPPVVIRPAPTAAIKSTAIKQSPNNGMAGLPSLSSLRLQSSLPVRKLRIGTSVRAQLVNPIAWAGSGQNVAFSRNGASTPKYIVQLQEPLNDTNGDVVVPQGGELVATVSQLEPTTGMAELTALQFIINDQEYAPPLGAISLRGADGNPLIAKKFHDKGKEIAAADRATFLFGALSKVGQLLNRSDSSVTISANGTSSSSTRNGRSNILGGVLEGGFSALAQQQQQRNQQWLQEIIQRPDIRYIPAGTPLTLYINQTVTL